MKNVKIKKEADKLRIEIDLKKEFGLSRSGKSIIVATTEGNQRIGDFYLGLNCYKFPERNW